MENDRPHSEKRPEGCCNIAMTWAPEGERKKGREKREDRKRPGGGQWKRKGKMQVGDHVRRQELQQPTGESEGLLWRPYAPRGA